MPRKINSNIFIILSYISKIRIYKLIQILMDLDHLQKLISKIDLRNQTINGITEYCILNSRGSENEIAKIIDKHFPSYYNQQMMAIMELVSQILVRTGDKRDDRFFKPLAPKAKVYIEEISRRVKQIKPQHVKIVPQILAKWSRGGKEIFSPSFMEKLRKTAQPLIHSANRYEQQRKNNLFQNYSKTFLMEYEDIKSYDPTSRIYDDYVNFEKISVEIGQINNEMKKLGLQFMTPEMCVRAGELRKKLQKFSQKLQQIICKYHIDFKVLRQAAKQQFDKLPQEAKQILQNRKQQ